MGRCTAAVNERSGVLRQGGEIGTCFEFEISRATAPKSCTQGCMPAPPSVGASSAGLRYQVRYFWRHALPMLYDTHIAKVVVEHRDVETVDDVVVYYAAPGVNDAGSLVTVDFTQLKFHVAETGAVDQDAVVDPSWTGTKSSLLKRFSDAWLDLRADHPGSRLNLVTNWPWNTASPLRPHLRDGGRLDDAFWEKGPKSEVGAIRSQWQTTTGLGDDDYRAFISALRISSSAVSQADAEERLRDRCQLAGLVAIDPSVDWSPYDDLGKRLIESGRTEHTPESLRQLMIDQKLVREDQVPPFRSTFAVCAFPRFRHVPETEGACVVDLTDLFNGRDATSEDVWRTGIRQRVEAVMPAVEKLAQPVHVALDVHLSIAWYAGSLLNPKSGIPVTLRQRTKGKGVQLWDVSTARRPEGAPEWAITPESVGDGADLAVVISVTHDAFLDSKRSLANTSVGTVLHLSLPRVGPASIVDGGHARWLADEVVRIVRDQAAKSRPARTHIFPATPASLMFLIGQEAQAIGPTTVYEFAFGDPSRKYQPGMTTDS
jgi:hypothetical protein